MEDLDEFDVHSYVFCKDTAKKKAGRMDVLEGKKDLDEFNVSFKDTTLTSK
jgi:hypothetical protein